MRKSLAALVFLASVFGAPVWAHHAFTAAFDNSKSMTVTGVLSRVEWQNPHVWFYVDVKDANGAVTNWGFETASPNHLRNEDAGLRQDFLSNIGKTMTVTGYPAKGSEHKASASSVTFASGKILKMGNGEPAPGENSKSGY
jgi:V8-like Glu-specific endopeptidase